MQEDYLVYPEWVQVTQQRPVNCLQSGAGRSSRTPEVFDPLYRPVHPAVSRAGVEARRWHTRRHSGARDGEAAAVQIHNQRRENRSDSCSISTYQSVLSIYVIVWAWTLTSMTSF